MKLATLDDGSRDGHLAVVSRYLKSAHFATGIAGTLQRVLDDWNFLAPQLQDLYATLNDGRARHAFSFDPAACSAPLPRAFERWQARPGVTLHQVAGDSLGPRAVVNDPADPADGAQNATVAAWRAALAVITGDVAAGTGPDAALETVRLLLLLADRPQGSAAYAPVSVTPDELGAAWRGGRPHLQLMAGADARRLEPHDAAAAMPRHFGQYIAEAAAKRRLHSGTVLCCPIESAAVPTGAGLHMQALDADGRDLFGSLVIARRQDPTWTS